MILRSDRHPRRNHDACFLSRILASRFFPSIDGNQEQPYEQKEGRPAVVKWKKLLDIAELPPAGSERRVKSTNPLLLALLLGRSASALFVGSLLTEHGRTKKMSQNTGAELASTVR